MGSAREACMWEWQRKYEACLRVAYMNYLKREIARKPFVDADTLSGWWQWCMDTCPAC